LEELSLLHFKDSPKNTGVVYKLHREQLFCVIVGFWDSTRAG